MKIWSFQDANARFSEMLKTCLEEGPQLVSRYGADAAVLVPVHEWRRLQHMARPGLKELLLSDEARGELNIPGRRRRVRTIDRSDGLRP
jgi:prevent-host-death family protein